MNFGTEVVLEGGGQPHTPTPRYRVHKAAGQPQISGGGSSLLTPNPDLKGPGPSVFLEPWCLTFKKCLENESCIVHSK